MKLTHLALVLGFLVLSTHAAFTIYPDFSDADSIWGGSDNAELKAKYILMRKVTSSVTKYFGEVLALTGTASGEPENASSNEKKSLAFSSFTAPFTGRLVDGRLLSSVNADYYVYVDAYSDAAAQITTFGKIHATHPTTKRPIAGSMNINLPLVIDGNKAYYHYFTIMCFDMLKILSFDKSVFGTYRDTSPTTTLNMANLIKKATWQSAEREFWIRTGASSAATEAYGEYGTGFDTLLGTTTGGILLDNGGDDYYKGNSFSKALYPNDFLNPTEEIPCLISEMGMKVAVDSGWYTVNTGSYFQPVTFGKVVGSSVSAENTFGQGACLPSNTDGYCNTNAAVGCSSDGTFKTYCKADPMAPNCMYQSGTDYCFLEDRPSTAMDFETFGPTARCVMVVPTGKTDAVPACMKVVATSATDVKFQNSDASMSLACTASGAAATLTGASGKVDSAKCPASMDHFYSFWSKSCQANNDCSAKGICLTDGTTPTCRCFWGWTGTKCDQAQSSEADNPVRYTGLMNFMKNFAGVTAVTWSVIGLAISTYLH